METETRKQLMDLVRKLPAAPGVYRMLDAAGEILYVGKARSLKQRVRSYFQKSDTALRKRALVEQIRDIEVTLTHTEGEALLLENHLIKEHQPRYNVLLRDDKGYPYIFLSEGEPFPRLAFHRGAKRAKGRYFGPYPNAQAVRESLNLLQKLFRVRQCEDSFFRNRSRPCLQYQIKRCSGPCVGLVDETSYAADVANTRRFLEGKNRQIINDLAERMEQAAERLDYEKAALYRDQIAHLRRVQERQYVVGEKGDMDVLAATGSAGSGCISLFFIRGGRNLGNKNFFYQLPEGADLGEMLASFLNQYYLRHTPPREILLSQEVEEQSLIETALSEAAAARVSLQHRPRGERARWVAFARRNAEQALKLRRSTRAGMVQRWESLREALKLAETPTRVECFDISHTQGEATVASCVVFDENGPVKSEYRRFNIEGITPGDDYGAMHQALSRRYRRVKEGEGHFPDLLLIDGGKGQVRQARDVLEELQVDQVLLVGVAKGAERRAGLETLVLSDSKQPIILPQDSLALNLIQQIRDEAHRFAITGHRQRRQRKRTTSVLEEIPGIGPKKRQLLLRQFGGVQELARAGVEDLATIHGIDRALAQRIYDAFHDKE